MDANRTEWVEEGDATGYGWSIPLAGSKRPIIMQAYSANRQLMGRNRKNAICFEENGN